MLYGNLEYLHPEYEVSDWRGRPYFIDFMLKIGHWRFGIDVKSYGFHVQNMDRVSYKKELVREMYMQVYGYRLIIIPYDYIVDDPELIRNLLKLLLGPYMQQVLIEPSYTRREREIILMGLKSGIVRPMEVSVRLEVNRRTAVKYLNELCSKGKFRAAPTEMGARVRSYEYIRSTSDELLL